MSRASHVHHEFVDQIPDSLAQDTLYVSIRYRMTAHLCLCGCTEKVVHPLRPNRWTFTFDGVNVSLSPSIGNDGLPCKSHYWITKSEVNWHPKLNDFQIAGARARDGWQASETVEPSPQVVASPALKLWRRVRSLLTRR